MKTAEALNQITKDIIGCAMAIHAEYGCGLLESAYRQVLAAILEERGYDVKQEVPVPLVYKGRTITEIAYGMDLLVSGDVIVECKCVETLLPVHAAQLRSHLKLAVKPLGLLINFRELVLTDGIKRVVNNFPEPSRLSLH